MHPDTGDDTTKQNMTSTTRSTSDHWISTTLLGGVLQCKLKKDQRDQRVLLCFSWGSRERRARFSSSQARSNATDGAPTRPRPTRAGPSGRRQKQAGSYAAGCLFAFAWSHGTQRYGRLRQRCPLWTVDATPRDVVCFSR